jgi:hypothetical protein
LKISLIAQLLAFPFAIFVGPADAQLPPGSIMTVGTAHSHSVSIPLSQMATCPGEIGPALPAPRTEPAGNLLSDPIVSWWQPRTLEVRRQHMATGDSGRKINAFGDYSQMTIDPIDDCTFWYTGTYIRTTKTPNDWHTRIGSFRFTNCYGRD